MAQLITESRQVARKRHLCDECERSIEAGQPYLRQRCKDGGDVWTFKAHADCAGLGQSYRDKNHLWGSDWYSVRDLIEPHEFDIWRGRFPHAVCRIEFQHQTRDH